MYFIISSLLIFLSCSLMLLVTYYVLRPHKSTCSFEIFNAIGNSIVITNSNNEIIYINKKYTDITEYTLTEVLGKNPNVLSSGKQSKSFYKKLWSALELTGQWEGEIWNRKKSGELYPEWININAIKDKNNVLLYYIAIFSDISARKKVEEKTMHYAYYDPLTGLPNRYFFKEHLEKIIKLSKRNQQKLAVVFIDLDKFKHINDQYGHHVGDLFLCEISDILSAKLRASDFLARFGGDEFVLLLPNIQSRKNALHFINMLESTVDSSSIQCKNYRLTARASMGCSIYPDDGLIAETLIHQADMKMYEVKKNRV